MSGGLQRLKGHARSRKAIYITNPWQSKIIDNEKKSRYVNVNSIGLV